MAISKDLLEYQEVDGELRKIEQEISSSEERKKYLQAKKFMETAGEKLEAQDKRACDLRALSEKLQAGYEEINRAISEYEELDEMVENGADVGFYKKNVQSLVDRLRYLKSEIQKLTENIESAIEEYRKMKKQTIAMQKQYKEYSEKFKEIKGARSKEVNEITGKLEAIAKRIPPEILAHYKAKRKEKIYPVVAPLKNDRCICGMDFPIAQQEALSGGRVVECEHCHRIIYKE